MFHTHLLPLDLIFTLNYNPVFHDKTFWMFSGSRIFLVLNNSWASFCFTKLKVLQFKVLKRSHSTWNTKGHEVKSTFFNTSETFVICCFLFSSLYPVTFHCIFSHREELTFNNLKETCPKQLNKHRGMGNYWGVEINLGNSHRISAFKVPNLEIKFRILNAQIYILILFHFIL